MPYYHQVLGAHVDLSDVPPEVRERAEKLFGEAAANGNDLSASDRDRILGELAALPGVRAEIACEGEDLERYMIVIERGTLDQVRIRDSRFSRHIETANGAPYAEVHAKTEGAVDDLIERLAGSEDEPDPLDDDGVQLPYRWPDRDVMLRAFASVAALIKERSVAVMVTVDDQRYDVAIDRKSVRCRALHAIAEHAPYTARFYELLGMRVPTEEDSTEVEAAKPPAAKRPPRFDPSRPFTTGTKGQRTSAVFDIAHGRGDDYAKQLSPSEILQLVGAAQDPANADPRYADVRREIYRHLARHQHDAVVQLFLWALKDEAENVVDTAIYYAWRQEALLEALPTLIADATALGHTALARRLKAALANGA
ncbi:MAG: hypothetical protein JWP01_2219 [Myxococcales bacterium]|nr:hypothetical protein [Myxococcales bacterium]